TDDVMTSGIYQDSAWATVTDASISLALRMAYSHTYYELVKARDSLYFYEQAISRFDSLYSHTSDSAAMRSLALLLKADVYERLDSLPKAIATDSVIIANF